MVRNDYLKEATYTARQEENCVKLYNVRHFDLPSTFENGQCFRWERMDSDRYIGVAKGKVLEVKKDGDLYLFYNTNLQEFEKVWVPYFTLDIDYDKVIKVLSKDPLLEKAIAFAPGLRLLRQDFHETLISFILSSNNNIQRIKKIIGNLCQAAGKDIRYNGKIYKTFPSIRDMKHLTCRDFLDMGAGYRSKYLEHTIQRLCCEDIDASFLRTCSLDQARKTLQQYMGIGVKVADCILLYSGTRYDCFPADVWIKKIMCSYLDDRFSVDDILEYASSVFGPYAGIAQQYLFHYARFHL